MSTKVKTKQKAYQIGAYEFRPSLYQLKHRDELIKLTARETELLRMLSEYKKQLLPRKVALNEIWGSNDEFSRKSMDVFVSHLRKHLSKDPNISIENVHGQGFILNC